MKRSQWGSRLGFIFASAGSAVGLGAIWKFPYMAGAQGGAAFILAYLAIAFTLGLGLMAAEMALGRAGRGGIVETFRRLGGRGWALGGLLAVTAGFLILAFYSVVGGWTLAYLIATVLGTGLTQDMGALAARFEGFAADGPRVVAYHAAFMALTVLVVGAGVQKGIERLSKWLMPTLFVLMLVLIARVLSLPGAMAGVDYLFRPDWDSFSTATLLEATGFVFFSLSLGMGAMITYGSYLDSRAPLGSSAGWVVLLATGTALLGGLMVLPAVFAFGMDPAAGPGLSFITMPAVFAQMPAGTLFAALFFASLMVAALTSSVSLLEVVAAAVSEALGVSHRAAAWASAGAIFLAGVPCALSFGAMSGYTLFGLTTFDLFDAVSSKLLLPLGGILVALLAGWVAWPRVAAQLAPAGATWLPPARLVIAVLAPLSVLVILLHGL
jgi:neurotransmitter:Na+ symporter, NSS family